VEVIEESMVEMYSDFSLFIVEFGIAQSGGVGG